MSNRSFYVIFNNTKYNNAVSLRPRAMFAFADDIIAAVERKLRRIDKTFEDIAGIGYVEDADGNLKPTRALTDDELLALSIKTLDNDGWKFILFENDEAGASAFISTAESYGLGHEARHIVSVFLNAQ